jgi:hypothetical protein
MAAEFTQSIFLFIGFHLYSSKEYLVDLLPAIR